MKIGNPNETRIQQHFRQTAELEKLSVRYFPPPLGPTTGAPTFKAVSVIRERFYLEFYTTRNYSQHPVYKEVNTHTRCLLDAKFFGYLPRAEKAVLFLVFFGCRAQCSGETRET